MNKQPKLPDVKTPPPSIVANYWRTATPGGSSQVRPNKLIPANFIAQSLSTMGGQTLGGSNG